jgi:hypothetical protein
MTTYRGNLKTRDGYLTIPDGAAIVDIDNPTHNKASKSRMKRNFTFWSKRHDDPLFAEGALTVDSIHQRTLGDCWFLAGVAAIVTHPLGSQLVKSSMVDCGDGTVIVRLYDGALTAHYIRVAKSRASYMGTNVGVGNVTKTGMWPVILEKAGCCFTGDERKQFSPNSLSYSNIESGNPDQVFRMLLGKNVRRQSVAADYALTESASQTWIDLQSVSAKFPPTEQMKAAIARIFGSSLSADTYRANYATAINKALRSANNLAQIKTAVAGLPGAVQGPLLAFAEREFQGSGDVGSGTYSARDLAEFSAIATALRSHCPVGTTTQKDLGPAERVGKSANEPMHKGMVGEHCYGVLDIFEETAMLRRRFIKVCNPWGSYGRTYTDNGPALTPSEQESGVFWLELRDFLKTTTSISYGPALNLELLMS